MLITSNTPEKPPRQCLSHFFFNKKKIMQQRGGHAPPYCQYVMVEKFSTWILIHPHHIGTIGDYIAMSYVKVEAIVCIILHFFFNKKLK